MKIRSFIWRDAYVVYVSTYSNTFCVLINYTFQGLCSYVNLFFWPSVFNIKKKLICHFCSLLLVSIKLSVELFHKQ
jgi:hypothetical protein